MQATLNIGVGLCALLATTAPLQAQTKSPAQTLAAMEKCREQVISQFSFSDKMKMKASMGVIQTNLQFIAANNAVAHASTPESQVLFSEERRCCSFALGLATASLMRLAITW